VKHQVFIAFLATDGFVVTRSDVPDVWGRICDPADWWVPWRPGFLDKAVRQGPPVLLTNIIGTDAA
jgi:hypothetical protein